MITKQYAWSFFNESLRILAQGDKKTVDFQEMVTLLQQIRGVYDNRTMKNYIDCMLANKWVTEDNSSNPLNPNSLMTSPESPLFEYSHSRDCITIYKHTIFNINKDAQYEQVKPKDIIENMLKRHKQTQ